MTATQPGSASPTRTGVAPLPVTVVCITRNEEEHIGPFLDNVMSFASEVFVLDSLSTDRTVDVALDRGALVVQRPFHSFGDQWHFALTWLPIKTAWVFKVDPDERVPAKLVDEIAQVISRPTPDAYYVRCRLWWAGKPLRQHLRVLRLWRKGAVSFSQRMRINEHPVPETKPGVLRGAIEHLDAVSLHRWFDKQNHYTSLVASDRFRGEGPPVRARLFGSRLQRRMWLRELYYRLPMGPTFEFLYRLIPGGALFSGRAGIRWARMRATVRAMIDAKLAEARASGREPPVPPRPPGVWHPRVLASEVHRAVAQASGEPLGPQGSARPADAERPR